MKRLAAAFLLFSILAWPAGVAWARPGGGQSFSSPGGGSPPGNYSGGSSGGSSGRSSGGSSWSSGESSKSSPWSSPRRDSSPTEPSSPTPSYSDEQRRELDAQIDRMDCMQKCMPLMYAEKGEQTSVRDCEKQCVATRSQARASERQRDRELEEQRMLEDLRSRDESLTRVLIVPVIVIGAAIFVIMIAFWYRRRGEKAWASGVLDDDELAGPKPASTRAQAGTAYRSVAAAIEAIKAGDDAFSWVLFEDFAHALYVEAHTSRGAGKVAQLAPYLAPEALVSLQALPANAVSAIVVGAIATDDVRVNPATRRITTTLSFTANYSEQSDAGSQGYYVQERWTFSRDADLPSRPPERACTIDCPSCGAALDKIVAGRCKYCSSSTAAGSHDWRVDDIRIIAREPRGPMLTGTTEEVGTDDPTVVALDVKQRFGELTARDPELTWLGFTQRVGKVFAELHRAWSAQQLAGVRPYLSDNLFEAQAYWVEAYQAAGLRNISEAPAIAAIHLSRVSSDKFYDALTVRTYGSCLDYTLNAKDELVAGNRTRPRQYSEYWTFIRGKGRTGAPSASDACPGCGADIAEINMAGVCQHCKVKVTSGAFDWVLSRIEQDEVYRL